MRPTVCTARDIAGDSIQQLPSLRLCHDQMDTGIAQVHGKPGDDNDQLIQEPRSGWGKKSGLKDATDSSPFPHPPQPARAAVPDL
jgi:hypothetical protein